MGNSSDRVNELGQPIGQELTGWTAPPRPQRTVLEGRYCRMEPLSPSRHAADLFAANALDLEGRMWTYLGSGPFATLEDFAGWLGPQLSGLVTPFPIVVILLTAFAHHQLGRAGATRVLRGFLIGMYAFAAFFFVVAGGHGADRRRGQLPAWPRRVPCHQRRDPVAIAGSSLARIVTRLSRRTGRG